MSGINRRHFLQFAGATLATLGISQLNIQQNALQYGNILAQDTRRKRALLIGINDYPGSDSSDFKTRGLWYQLRGAVNDVELQRELLIHRFGFHADDILVLSNQDATRNNILNAFEKHLYQWVKSNDDVVIFHYSGHGSNVIDPNQVFMDGLNGTIVPVDAQLPDGFPQSGGEVDDITAGTIFLLREALGRKTKNATFILDSCYSGGGVRGNLVMRSRPGHIELRGDSPKTKLEASQEELAYQERWLKELQLSEEEWIQRRKQNKVNGVAIFAAQRNQEAADAAFAPGVHAGVFTYSLIRQLWQQTSHQSMGKIIVAASAKTEQFLKGTRSQKPDFEVQPGSQDNLQPMYFTPMQKPAAEAVITEVKDKVVKLLLTGVEPQVLEGLGKGAVFTLVNDAGKPQGSVQIQSRDRLTATGILKTNSAVKVTPGATLQEQIRAVPTDLKLRIGLDPSLGQDIATAREALQSFPRIEVVPLLEQEAHYLLGRMLPDYRQRLEKQTQATLPPANSLGLFAVGLEPIPGSFGEVGEAVEQAIARLQTKFRLLLAARLIKMTLNTNSSQLKIVAQMESVRFRSGTNSSFVLSAQAFTVRSGQVLPQSRSPANSAGERLDRVAINQPVQISVANQEPYDVHIGVMIFSPDGDIDVLFPLASGENAARVPAGQTLKIPSDVDIESANLSFKQPLGLAELLVVASRTPIDKALRPIQALAAEKNHQQRSESQVVEKTEAVVVSLLDDLAGGTRGGTSSTPVHKLDVRQMAALSITFEIVGDRS